jgi:DNA-binding beta-propeller fold protein YncE
VTFHSQFKPKGNLGLLTVALALAVLSGCATRARTKPIDLVWPEPPETPRIRFVRALSNEWDLKQPGLLQSSADMLIGRRRNVESLHEPLALAVSDDGKRLYVSDYERLAVYVFDFTTNKVTIIGQETPLGRPLGLALDAAQNLYVADQEGKRVLVFDTTTYAPQRVIKLSDISRPSGIAIDRARKLLYVADTSTNDSDQHFVKVYDLDGNFVRNVGKGRGMQDGYLMFPTYVSLDPDGNVYVSDTMNSRISVFDPEGNFSRTYGEMGDHWGEMNKPKGVALDSFGNVYVVDSAWSVVQIFNKRGDVLLFFGGRHRLPGMMENPTGVAIDRNNRIYVADTFNFRVNVYDLVNTTAADSVVDAPPEKGGDGEQTQHVQTSGLPVKPFEKEIQTP